MHGYTIRGVQPIESPIQSPHLNIGDVGVICPLGIIRLGRDDDAILHNETVCRLQRYQFERFYGQRIGCEAIRFYFLRLDYTYSAKSEKYKC